MSDVTDVSVEGWAAQAGRSCKGDGTLGGKGDRGLVVGLTGGIATGKSTVANMLRNFGAVVVSADEIARDIVAPGSPAAKDIRALFGDEVFLADGTLDRPALGQIVFADEEARRRLENITHPRIREEMGRRIAVAAEEGHIVVAEIPLLFESEPARTLVDVTVVVATDEDVQLGRLMARDDLTRAEALQRVQAQLPLSEKIAQADYVVDNGGTRQQTEQAVRRLWSRLAGRT